ncbi:MAG: hypothetical protein ACRDUV_09015 [Pseudonocardiaceae bacterium]
MAVFRSAETAFRVDEGGRRIWPRDFTALDTTLRQDPNTYRVRWPQRVQQARRCRRHPHLQGCVWWWVTG